MTPGTIAALAVAALALVLAFAAYCRADAALKRADRIERPDRRRMGDSAVRVPKR